MGNIASKYYKGVLKSIFSGPMLFNEHFFNGRTLVLSGGGEVDAKIFRARVKISCSLSEMLNTSLSDIRTEGPPLDLKRTRVSKRVIQKHIYLLNVQRSFYERPTCFLCGQERK